MCGAIFATFHFAQYVLFCVLCLRMRLSAVFAKMKSKYFSILFNCCNFALS